MMVECKVVVNDVKTGRSYQKVLAENIFLGKKLGDKVAGNDLGLEGFELEITGASDSAGFPVRRDLSGIGRSRVVLTAGPGLRLRNAEKGIRVKKTVVANNIDQNIVQVNVKVVAYGPKGVEESLGVQQKEEVKVAG